MHHFDCHKATSLEDAFQKVSASPGAIYLGGSGCVRPDNTRGNTVAAGYRQ